MNRQSIGNLILESVEVRDCECLNVIFENESYNKEVASFIVDSGIEDILDYLLDDRVKFGKAEVHMFHSVMMRLRLDKKLLVKFIDKLELVMEKVTILKNVTMRFYIADYFSSYCLCYSMKVLEAEARIQKFV